VTFEVVGDIKGIETFAVGRSIRELPRLRKFYGKQKVAKAQGLHHRQIAWWR